MLSSGRHEVVKYRGRILTQPGRRQSISDGTGKSVETLNG